MNDRSAKIGVWAYLLFTLASFALALYLLLAEGGRSEEHTSELQSQR